MAQSRPFGMLNLDKPAGVTSRKVVDHVQRLVRPARAGHAGTLDPMATGVLVVCVGPATRLISLLQEQPKEYRAHFVLGCRSDTDDVTGQVADVPGAPPVSREQVEALLPRFTGAIRQVPPRFSAVHVEGRRAYKLARQGDAFELAPRTVEVHRLELVEFDPPRIGLDIECGSGTYIRAIGRDLGEALGCGAVMSGLVRTRVGAFRLDDALAPERIDEATLPEQLLPATRAVEHLPQVRCSPEDLARIRHGRPVADAVAETAAEGVNREDGSLVAILSPDGELACVAAWRLRDGALAPKMVFV